MDVGDDDARPRVQARPPAARCRDAANKIGWQHAVLRVRQLQPRHAVLEEPFGDVIELADTWRDDYDAHRGLTHCHRRRALDEERLAGAGRRLDDRDRVSTEQRSLDCLVDYLVRVAQTGLDCCSHGRLAARATASAERSMDGRAGSTGATVSKNIQGR